MSITSNAFDQVALRQHYDITIEPFDLFDEEFFFPDVSDVITEDYLTNRFEIERSDIDDLVDGIDLNQHDPLYDTNA